MDLKGHNMLLLSIGILTHWPLPSGYRCPAIISYPSNSQCMLFINFFAEASVQNFHTYSDLVCIIPIFPEKYALWINLNVFVHISESDVYSLLSSNKVYWILSEQCDKLFF